MALTTEISQKELERQAALCFEGETLKVMLCEVGSSGYTALSTVANWQSVEIADTGYVRGSEVIATGAWDAIEGAYVIPDIDVTFTAGAGGIQYDRVIIYVDGATYIHSMLTENPFIALADGQSKPYRLSLMQDD